MYADITDLARDAMVFRARLQRTKAIVDGDVAWYPYDTLSNFVHLDQLLQGEHRSVFEKMKNKTIADIGAADGDLAFFFESLGNQVDIIDYAPTNFNHLAGATRLRDHLSSTVSIHDIDLDSQFSLPRERYDLIFFLGILYHLKNPYYMMEQLAKRAEFCFLSTKVTKNAGGTSISTLPVAYLLGADEANNDATNFWVFTDVGLKRLLSRTGWEVISYITVGNVVDSDPSSAAGDERAFAYLRSRQFAAGS